MIMLTAAFNAKTGKEAELELILKGIIPKVQNEIGTKMYNLNRSKEDKGLFLFCEMYEDETALNFHMATPYFQELLKDIEGLIDKEPQIVFYENIASISR